MICNTYSTYEAGWFGVNPNPLYLEVYSDLNLNKTIYPFTTVSSVKNRLTLGGFTVSVSSFRVGEIYEITTNTFNDQLKVVSVDTTNSTVSFDKSYEAIGAGDMKIVYAQVQVEYIVTVGLPPTHPQHYQNPLFTYSPFAVDVNSEGITRLDVAELLKKSFGYNDTIFTAQKYSGFWNDTSM